MLQYKVNQVKRLVKILNLNKHYILENISCVITNNNIQLGLINLSKPLFIKLYKLHPSALDWCLFIYSHGSIYYNPTIDVTTNIVQLPYKCKTLFNYLTSIIVFYLK